MARIKINELPAIAQVVTTTEFAADDIGQTGQTTKVTGQQLQDFISVGAGNISIVGTPVADQVMVWASAASAEGDANFTWNGTTLAITGNITVTGTVDGVDVSTLLSATEANVVAALNGATLTDIGTPAATDRILLQDASDSNNLKYADFSEFGGGGSFNNFILSGDSGPNQTVDDGETVTITGGTNATTVASATNTITVNVDDSFILNTGDIGTGVYDFGGATSFEIPNSATPTVDAAGEIAVDTTITNHTGQITYHDGTEALFALGMPTANLTSASDGQFVSYNATNDELEFATPAGGGNVSNTGTPADGQLAVWTTSTTIEGDAALTFDTTTDTLTIAASGNLNFGAVTVIDDNAGATTLQNIDAIDATTEATIEAAIDTLTSVTLAGSTGTGVHDFGGATSFEIPNSAAPTVDVAGEIAVDTTITDYTGMIKYHDGTEELTVIAMPTANLSTTNGQVVSYNATNNELEFTTPAGGGNVSNTGTPVDNQLAVWTNATTIEGDAGLTWNTATNVLTVGGSVTSVTAFTRGVSNSNLVLSGDTGTAQGANIIVNGSTATDADDVRIRVGAADRVRWDESAVTLRPGTDSTYDLGTTAIRWRELFVDDITVTTNVSINGSDAVTLAATQTLTNKTLDDAKLEIDINAQTGTTYTLVLADASKFITMNNAAANTLTIPPNSSVAFPIGTEVAGAQIGAGQTTLTPGAGVTLNAADSNLATRVQHSGWSAIKTATDTWQVFGDLA